MDVAHENIRAHGPNTYVPQFAPFFTSLPPAIAAATVVASAIEQAFLHFMPLLNVSAH